MIFGRLRPSRCSAACRQRRHERPLNAVSRDAGPEERVSAGVLAQRVELVIGSRVVERLSSTPSRRFNDLLRCRLAGVDDHAATRGSPDAARGARRPTEGPPDEHDPVGVDLGHGPPPRPPCRARRSPSRVASAARSLIQRRCRFRVRRGPRSPAPVEGVEHRRVRLLGGAVVPAEVENRGERAVALGCEEVTGVSRLEDTAGRSRAATPAGMHRTGGA